MWKSSQRADEVSTPGIDTSGSSFTSTQAASVPLAAAESPHGDSVLSQGASIVGKLLVVKGEISGNEALVVEGEVEGSITLHGQRLTIRPNGRIHGDIEARHVVLHGRVDGDIHASERVELFRDSSFTGDLSTVRISIEDGAFFKGKLEIKKPETALGIETKPRPAVSSMSQHGPILEGAAKKSGNR